jgi:hypothetical protein
VVAFGILGEFVGTGVLMTVFAIAAALGLSVAARALHRTAVRPNSEGGRL